MKKGLELKRQNSLDDIRDKNKDTLSPNEQTNIEEKKLKIEDKILLNSGQGDNTREKNEEVITRLKGELVALKKENSELKDAIAGLTKKNSNMQKENSELKDTIAGLTKENSELKNAIDGLKKENSELKNAIARLTKENSNIQKVNLSQKDEIAYLKKVINKLNAQINELNEQKEASNKFIKLFMTRLDGIEKYNKVLQKKVDKLEIFLKAYPQYKDYFTDAPSQQNIFDEKNAKNSNSKNGK